MLNQLWPHLSGSRIGTYRNDPKRRVFGQVRDCSFDLLTHLEAGILVQLPCVGIDLERKLDKLDSIASNGQACERIH